jgi:phosphonate transport system permease protein
MRVEVFAKKRRNSLVFFTLLAIVTIFVMAFTKFDASKGIMSLSKALVWSLSNFYPDAKAFTKISNILIKLRETVLMAIASTTSASVFALVFAIFGSKVTKINGFLSTISRGIASVSRNIPIVAWAMVLLFSFGQSSLTGYFALFFVTFGFLTRAFIETIDEASSESVEALKATGASYMHIIFQAVIPSAISQMISWILYMIETNIRSSTLVGILTGTGIGFSFDLYYKSMNYNAASLVVIVIVITVFIIEYTSNYIRRVIL